MGAGAADRDSERLAARLTASDLAERTLQRRAVEAAIWGMPIVSVDSMRQAFFRDCGARYSDIIYWSRPVDWQFQVTTPQASSYHVYFHFNTKEGPVVLEVPAANGAGLFGSLLDAWQVPQIDIGPQGDDRGHGARFLLLPPAYDLEQDIPDDVVPIPLNTFNGFSFLRAMPESASEADVRTALDLVRSLRLYPLSHAATLPVQRFIDMSGKLFDGITHYDDSFYDSLARMVNEEPVQSRDLVAMGQLRSLGIGKGQDFDPDSVTRQILASAIAEAHAILMHATTVGESFWPGSCWIQPGAGLGPRTSFGFQTKNRLDIDERGMWFYLGCAPAKRARASSFHIYGMRDSRGHILDGGKSYRLHVPSKVPTKQLWALSAYDVETCSFIRLSDRIEVNSSDPNIKRNLDDSVDVFFGPKMPPGRNINWVYTAPGRSWFAAFRFFGPEQDLFERKWRLPDIEPGGAI